MNDNAVRSRPGTGLIIGIVFGLVFVIVNSGPLGSPASTVLRIAGVAVAAVLLFVLQARVRGGTGVGLPRDGGVGFTRGYWIVVAIEVVALFGGLMLINGVFGHGEFGVAWVAVVVGLHFVGLGVVWHAPSLHVLGGVLTGLGILGAVLGLATGSAAWIAGVAGVGSGAALLAGTAYALWAWRDISTA
ncbi:MAG: hypothetical protein J0I34_12655 [Pseudonocardia sp.]|uniref:hypothetical protein n=1 Tax=unclassified Pseudonocardia TaxID=2619320 RepID=UPI0008695640|nr:MULTISPECIES: hypothetical protein [unclassified Pseudonocardia]MBN9109625.1 hypothetical protein [Pseudonocardia sp.]ODU24649.1 MAG: hypothetical protein ABS80_11780 [Pseudonocardia sp. SCN 72-51]ODV09060.1 MAG: hypothetical protein ABT15_00025 [Pseudonocardia sp. SCN 73-27]